MSTNVIVNKKHYYFSVEDFGAIVDAHFAYEDEAVGKPVSWLYDHRKAVWNAKFRLYVETENILNRLKDENCALFPLYRWSGQDDEDFIFETREAAEKEYTEHIEQAIADRLYDL